MPCNGKRPAEDPINSEVPSKKASVIETTPFKPRTAVTFQKPYHRYYETTNKAHSDEVQADIKREYDLMHKLLNLQDSSPENWNKIIEEYEPKAAQQFIGLSREVIKEDMPKNEGHVNALRERLQAEYKGIGSLG